MKRWALLTLFLYVFILIIWTVPFLIGVFYTVPDVFKTSYEVYGAWQYWVWVVVVLTAQFSLLLIPIRVATRRPTTKKHIVFSIIFSALMMGALFAGAYLAIAETIKADALYKMSWYIAYGVLFLSWIFWSRIFWKWSKKEEPKGFVEKICKTFFKGSVLELLVAVPTHVVARYRDYCCAGYSTFIGIALGLSIMFMSFGPSVFFLYVERWRKLHPKK